MNLALTQQPSVSVEWRKRSLRQCLLALGVTDAEMRYRPGARSIVEGWTGELDTLLNLTKRRWKRSVVKHHEANGGDPEMWKLVNVIYSTAVRKITQYIRKRESAPAWLVECRVCGRSVERKGSGAWQTFLCGGKDCKREWRRRKDRTKREFVRPQVRRECKRCQRSFFTVRIRKVFCCAKCQVQWWNDVRPSPPGRHIPHATLPPEKREKILARARERYAERREAGWRRKKSRIPRTIKDHRKRPTLKQRLEALRVKYDGKPWLFETYEQKLREKNREYCRRWRERQRMKLENDYDYDTKRTVLETE